jgi:D-amino-acid dehydrogenase
MEINGMDRHINMKRVNGIVKSLPVYFPELAPVTPPEAEVWNGLRPCSPDGLPYIGRAGKFRNLVVASGHGMMGVSLAPATGKLVASIVQNGEIEIPMVLFDPNRFSSIK